MTVSLLTGDCRELLRAMPTASVQCAITSPPYWGLRDYKGEPQVWGGDADHAHTFGDAVYLDKRGSGADNDATGRQRGEVYGRNAARGAFCGCGAWLGQLGLETTPQAYAAHLVEVFAEVGRVLRPDATLWLVLGDTYAASRSYQVRDNKHTEVGNNSGMSIPPGFKSKDLIGIPWRTAFALQDVGWWLRSDIVWAKSNPMPESVRDRPTRSHEYLFLLSKSQTYYYDNAAIKEPFAASSNARLAQATFWKQHGGAKDYGTTGVNPNRSARGTLENIAANGVKMRNKRDVWNIPTKPYTGAHFAVFPEKLVEPCILAGSKPGDVVLDPFGGAGTVALVADRLGRSAISIDINEEYSTLSAERIFGKQEPVDERSA